MNTNQCDAFGNVLRATGSLAFVNPFVFSTKFCDWETGFYYYGYRYYDSSVGRWLSRDPIGENGGANIYVTVKNNSLAFIDRDGRDNLHLSPMFGSQQNYLGSTSIPIFESPVDPFIFPEDPISASMDEFADVFLENLHDFVFGKDYIELEDGTEVPILYGVAPDIRATQFSKCCPRFAKSFRLPGVKKVSIDMPHVISGHTSGGARAMQSGIKNLFPTWMKPHQIEKSILDAYKNAKVISQQCDPSGVLRLQLRGSSGGVTLEMWYNTVTKTIESAYPIWK